jgi:diguanylate cyclase (GGDEF)-like protein
VTPELEKRLGLLIDFPSPAGVAAQVVNAANNPEADIGIIARTISVDPAMSAKMLRTANSPFYGQRRKSQNLRQAIMVLGLNATITLALGFSLVKTFEQHTGRGLDYPRFWRRALLSAIAARSMAEVKALPYKEEIFLAALLQDIGVLAIDRSHDGFYLELPREASHAELVAYERERFGCDHSEVGAWLLRSWSIPGALCDAIEASHQLTSSADQPEAEGFLRPVAFSGVLADGLMAGDGRVRRDQISEREKELLSIDEAALTAIVDKIKEQIPETESLFEREIMGAWEFDALMGRAREVMLMRSLDTLRAFERLTEEHTLLAARTEELRRASSRDGLTGVYNRVWFEHKLQEEFDAADDSGWPLSLIFADLDHFKYVNDLYGHQVGDEVLRTAVALISNHLREGDVVARYGGEEFVVLLPCESAKGAVRVAERIVNVFRQNIHTAGINRFQTTISIGVATKDGEHRFASPNELVRAADVAVYNAKRRGRDRVVLFDCHHAE